MKRRWFPELSNHLSMRRQLWLALTLTLLFALLFNSGLGNLIVRHEVDEVFDAHLVTTTRVLKTLILRIQQNHPQAPTENGLGNLFDDMDLFADLEQVPETALRYEKKILLQLWSQDGSRVLYQSPQSPQHALAPMRAGLHSIELGDQSWQVFVTRIPEVDAWLMVGEIPDARDEIGTVMMGILLVSGTLALLLASVMATSAIDYGLRPLGMLRERLQERTLDNLQPVQLQPEPSELQPVINSLNRLFERLRDGVERERRFVADAAHELRTPLAVTQLEAQQLQRLAREQGVEDKLDGLMAGIQRGTHIVEQLLMLARLEPNGQGALLDAAQLSRMELAEAVRRMLAEQYQEITLEGGDLTVQLDDDLGPVDIDPVLLGIALRNLLINGVRYGGGELTISGVPQDAAESGSDAPPRLGLRIRDHGPGVPGEVLQRLTEPFFRNGLNDGKGAGLGLSITQRIVQALGGELEMTSAPGQGLVATIWLPQALVATR